MDLVTPAQESAPFQLQALVTVGRAAEKGLADPQRALIEAIRDRVLALTVELDSLPPIESSALAECRLEGSEARQLVRLMVVLSLADGPPSERQMALISSFATALQVREPAVQVVGHLARGRVVRFKLAFARRSHVRIYLRNSYRLLGGILPLARAILRFRGVIGEDPELAARFHALADLPSETLGYHFYHHCRDADLPFSGERGGFPPGALYHDFAHVLSGYDTSPNGEMKAAAFQAGFTQSEEDYFTALFAIVIHTAGINLTPFPMPVRLGRIGEGHLAVEVLHALERGAAMKVDLGDNWNFWEFVELPIEQVRSALGIPPITLLDGAP